MTLDIHTHNYRPDDPCIQVLNIRLRPETSIDDFPPPADNLLLSAGIHPWDTESFIASRELEEKLLTIFSSERIRYIGETGLDKLKGAPMLQQLALLELQLALANQLHKPVIIHCVKAMQEMIAIKRDYPDISEWIVHGFRGKATQAQQWLDHGFSLSFGPRHDSEAFALCPPSRRYNETDDSFQEMGTVLISEEKRAVPISPLQKNDYLCSY